MTLCAQVREYFVCVRLLRTRLDGFIQPWPQGYVWLFFPQLWIGALPVGVIYVAAVQPSEVDGAGQPLQGLRLKPSTACGGIRSPRAVMYRVFGILL